MLNYPKNPACDKILECEYAFKFWYRLLISFLNYKKFIYPGDT